MLVLYFVLIAFVVAVDQFLKNLVVRVVGIGMKPLTVIEDFFYISCHRNSGAAWGILKDGRLFFLILTPILLAAMLILMIRLKEVLPRLALAFIIGGAIGNFIDRLLVGSVVDFLDFYIFGYNFPTFNAADSSIVLGAALLIVFSFRTVKVTDKAKDMGDSPDNGSID